VALSVILSSPGDYVAAQHGTGISQVTRSFSQMGKERDDQRPAFALLRVPLYFDTQWVDDMVEARISIMLGPSLADIPTLPKVFQLDRSLLRKPQSVIAIIRLSESTSLINPP
jgi:hypothetical protein